MPNDSVTVSAPAGRATWPARVTFTLYSNGTCDWHRRSTSMARSRVSGASPQTVNSSNTTRGDGIRATFSWKVNYDSTNPAQRDIPASCHETSALTITNGGTISSP